MTRLLMTLDAVGGVWRYALDLGRGLRARDHEVIFVGFGPRPTEAQREEAEAVDLRPPDADLGLALLLRLAVARGLALWLLRVRLPPRVSIGRAFVVLGLD